MFKIGAMFRAYDRSIGMVIEEGISEVRIHWVIDKNTGLAPIKNYTKENIKEFVFGKKNAWEPVWVFIGENK